jgi:Transposase
VENGKCIEHGGLDHTPEAVDLWAAELARRFGGRPIAVALEQSRGSLVFMLTKYAHLVIFPIPPTTSVNYRKGFRPSGAKSDPSDAGMLLDLLVRHREKLRRLDPDTEETRTLQFLVEERRKFVNDKTRYANRLTACLKLYFPQVLVWFHEVSSQIVGDFLELWPTLEQLHEPDHKLSASSWFNTTVANQTASIVVWSKSAKLCPRLTTRR